MTYSDNTSFGSYSVVVRWKPGKCQLSRNKRGKNNSASCLRRPCFFQFMQFFAKVLTGARVAQHSQPMTAWNPSKAVNKENNQWLKHGFSTQHMQNHPSWETSRWLINSRASPLICFLFQPHPFCLYFLESLVEVWLRDREEAKKEKDMTRLRVAMLRHTTHQKSSMCENFVFWVSAESSSLPLCVDTQQVMKKLSLVMYPWWQQEDSTISRRLLAWCMSILDSFDKSWLEMTNVVDLPMVFLECKWWEETAIRPLTS